MMAVTDIIGFSFFIILPGCLPVLLSLVTVDRFISSAFYYLSRTHTPPRHTTPRFFLLAFFVLSFFPALFPCFSFLFERIPRPHHGISRIVVLPSTLSFLPLARAKFLLLVSIWYGCSLHFFGSFVIDRAIRLLNYSTAERRVVWRRAERDIDGWADGRT